VLSRLQLGAQYLQLRQVHEDDVRVATLLEDTSALVREGVKESAKVRSLM